MYSREKLEAVFHEEDLAKLDVALSAVGDELEYSNLTAEEVKSIIDYFFSRINNYTDKMVVENILNICLRIMDAHNIFCGFNLDIVLPHISTMDKECISYILTFLGFSGNMKYEKFIKNFLQNDDLKEDAEEALLELRHKAKRELQSSH